MIVFSLHCQCGTPEIMYNILQSKYLPQEQTIENMAEWSVRTKYSFTKKKKRNLVFFFCAFFRWCWSENALLLKVTSTGHMAVAGWSFLFSFRVTKPVWNFSCVCDDMREIQKKKGMGMGSIKAKYSATLKKSPNKIIPQHNATARKVIYCMRGSENVWKNCHPWRIWCEIKKAASGNSFDFRHTH